MNADPRLPAPKSSALYLAGAVMFVVTACLIPPWQGRFYNQDAATSLWHDGGTFGLNKVFAPLFNPPQASSNAIFGKVRFPWQPVIAHEQIQIDVVAWAAVLQLGLAAIGLLARLAAAVESPGRPGPIVLFGFALAVSQIVSLATITIYARAMLVSGNDQVVWMLFLVCGAIGCLVGLWQARRAAM